jgi:hypothetical protein
LDPDIIFFDGRELLHAGHPDPPTQGKNELLALWAATAALFITHDLTAPE